MSMVAISKQIVDMIPRANIIPFSVPGYYLSTLPLALLRLLSAVLMILLTGLVAVTLAGVDPSHRSLANRP